MQNSDSLVTDRLTSKAETRGGCICYIDLGLYSGTQKGRAAVTEINFLTTEPRELFSLGEMPQAESQAVSACGGVSTQAYVLLLLYTFATQRKYLRPYLCCSGSISNRRISRLCLAVNPLALLCFCFVFFLE